MSYAELLKKAIGWPHDFLDEEEMAQRELILSALAIAAAAEEAAKEAAGFFSVDEYASGYDLCVRHISKRAAELRKGAK